MHVLILGGTGLISTAIARQLLESGEQVTLFNRGKSENRLPEGAAVEIVVGDRRDYAAFEQTFVNRRFDVVVDMLAFHPDDSASAVRAFSGRCSQFIMCSTVCVYSGPPHTIPIPETEPYHSIGQYGKNKAAAEEFLLERHEDNGFPVTVIRPSQSYGEGGRITRPWGAPESLIDRFRKHKPVIVPGDGMGLWAACHVDDVARGFILTMGNPKCIGETYNLTGEENMTWDTYLRICAEASGGGYDPCYIPTDVLRKVAPQRSHLLWEIFAWPGIFDNRKIRQDAGWTGQTIHWREGVARTIAWMDANHQHAPSDADDYEDRLAAAWRAGVVPVLPTE